jgi:type II secretory pathway pseudopilin PulG
VNRIAIHCAIALTLAAAAAPGFAAGKGKQSEAQAAYQQERARCLRGDSGQARSTCLKEAGAAYDEARRGRLANAPDTDLARNATQRCSAQPAADRDACVRRVTGAGNTEGSVKGGGLIRETETTTEIKSR